jgi:hypothetical protein
MRCVTTISLIILLLAAGSAAAQETKLTVRVKSKDAKFIGTSMGGMLITLKDVDTGELLAKGVTAGSTGNTDRIMKTPHKRGDILSDASSARFEAILHLDEPTLVEIKAFGPLAQRQSANVATLTQWVIPGKHLTGGDGIVLEMPGFAVDILSPPAHQSTSRDDLPLRIDIEANVIMMCGCPLMSGGLWNADRVEVHALVKRNGKNIGEIPLQFGSENSRFIGTINVTEPGTYEVAVYAYEAATGNTGLDRTSFLVQ